MVVLQRQKATWRVKQNKITFKGANTLQDLDFWKVNTLKFFENIHVKPAVLKNML